jgi:hypothetical protein
MFLEDYVMNHVELIIERTNDAAERYGYSPRAEEWAAFRGLCVLLAVDAFGNIELAEKEEYEYDSV